MFRLEMHRIRLSNLFHVLNIRAAKLKDLSNYSSFLLIQTNTWERNGQQKL